MTSASPRAASRRWLVWTFVAAGFAIFAGANAHLVYVAVQSQSGCVEHSKSAGENHDYRAAKSAC